MPISMNCTRISGFPLSLSSKLANALPDQIPRPVLQKIRISRHSPKNNVTLRGNWARIQIATILSFITAPFYAILNYRLVTSENMPDIHKPSKRLSLLSIIGIIFLSLFAVGYVLSRFI